MTTPETKPETAGYEPPKLVILGPAEALTKNPKFGSGSDSQSAFHLSV